MTSAVAARLDGYAPLVLDEMRAVIGADQVELFAWMRYHLGWEDLEGRPSEGASGKLLRPGALLLAAELVGGSVEQALPAAAAVELVHNFSLLHDDVEDGSERRHGRPTLWSVSGVAQAINTGDALFTLAHLAMHRLLEADVDERRVIESMRELDEACIRLVEGQYLDISFEQRKSVTREEYLSMAAGKTAAMFAAPFAIGALLGEASGGTVAAFRRFGYHVGLAFQAMDDVLGIWGEPSVTGKPVGDDLLSRKMTYPVIVAGQAPGESGAAFTRAYAGAARLDVAQLTSLVDATGAREATEELIASEISAALDALQFAGLDRASLELCAEFAQLASGREK